MAELAKSAVIDHSRKTLTIDGQEFPWYIAEGGIGLTMLGGSELIRVCVDILVTAVEVIPEPATEVVSEIQIGWRGEASSEQVIDYIEGMKPGTGRKL